MEYIYYGRPRGSWVDYLEIEKKLLLVNKISCSVYGMIK